MKYVSVECMRGICLWSICMWKVYRICACVISVMGYVCVECLCGSCVWNVSVKIVCRMCVESLCAGINVWNENVEICEWNV